MISETILAGQFQKSALAEATALFVFDSGFSAMAMLSSGSVLSRSSTTNYMKPPTYSLHLRGRMASRQAVSSIQNPFMRWNLNCVPRASVCVQCRSSKEVRKENKDENVENIAADDVGSKTKKKKKLAVFVSGGGSNFRALHQASLDHRIHGEFIVLVTDKPRCRASEYARESNIPIIIFPKSNNELSGLSPVDLVTTLRHFEIDFLLLAGYLKLIPSELVQAYPRSILNIHPSLLPAFGGKGYYGMKVHNAVIASGARFSGPTIHFVDEKYDTGKILAQRVVPVLVNDTAEDLAARVLQEEHSMYAEVVAALCEDRIFWRADGVPIIRKSFHSDEYY